MRITLEAGRDRTDLAALQALAEAGVTLIARQLVACRVAIDLLRMVTLMFFEYLADQQSQTYDQDDDDDIVNSTFSMDYLR